MSQVDSLAKAITEGLQAGSDASLARRPGALIVEYLSAHGVSSISDISDATGLRYFKVLSCLGYLRKQGRVTRVAKARYRLA